MLVHLSGKSPAMWVHLLEKLSADVGFTVGLSAVPTRSGVALMAFSVESSFLRCSPCPGTAKCAAAGLCDAFPARFVTRLYVLHQYNTEATSTMLD